MSKFSSFAGGFTGYNNMFTKPPGITATGGTISIVGAYRYHLFTTSGTLSISSLGSVPNNNLNVIMIAGGGGGGSGASGVSGGGGAGGCIEVSNITPTVTSYSITIGGGGGSGAQGGNTTAFGYTLVGGGYGGIANAAGGNGGSGGGGGVYGSYSTNSTSGGKGVYSGSTYLNQTPAQGTDGGGGFSYNWGFGGGGGGATLGGNWPGSAFRSADGFGGNGYYTANFAQFGDTGNLGYFASGGTAYRDEGQGYAPSNKVPGGGGNITSPAGLNNTGGGGGGIATSILNTTSSGGSGVVIVRYLW